MPVANLNGLQVVIHEGEVLTNAEQWAAKLDASSAEIAQLKAQIAQQQKSNRGMTTRMSRVVDIESHLIKVSSGQMPMLTKKDCRIVALRLGTDEKEWSDIVKNHVFGSE